MQLLHSQSAKSVKQLPVLLSASRSGFTPVHVKHVLVQPSPQSCKCKCKCK